jgi:ubiquinone/menaquinone biosynthesis C-methylase UbiE
MGNTERFNAFADQYDTPERLAVANASASAIRRTVGSAHGKTAIDYGCGTGLVGLRLSDIFADILLVDASPTMIRQVEAKITACHIGSAHTLCRDFLENPPAELESDYVFLVQVLLHEKDTKALLEVMSGLLKPGGHLIIIDFDKNEQVVSPDVHNGFHQSSLCELLRSLSLKVVLSETFYHGERLFMNKDASMFIIDCKRSKGACKNVD